jgi:hypothetical protein
MVPTMLKNHSVLKIENSIYTIKSAAEKPSAEITVLLESQKTNVGGYNELLENIDDEIKLFHEKVTTGYLQLPLPSYWDMVSVLARVHSSLVGIVSDCECLVDILNLGAVQFDCTVKILPSLNLTSDKFWPDLLRCFEKIQTQVGALLLVKTEAMMANNAIDRINRVIVQLYQTLSQILNLTNDNKQIQLSYAVLLALQEIAPDLRTILEIKHLFVQRFIIVIDLNHEDNSEERLRNTF